ncbi:MAG: PilN domain-containing protein [Marinicella sp.]
MTTYIEKISEPIMQWYQTSSIHAFFNWWSHELKGLVPEQYRTALFPESVAVYVTGIEDEENGVHIWQSTDEGLQQITFDDSVKGKEWWHKLNHYLGISEVETEVTYLLPEAGVLARNVAMPIAVINDIDSVLSFELDKYIPFKVEDVVFSYRKGDVVEGSEKFPIMLTAIKKKELSHLIDLFETKGLQLSSIDVNLGTAEAPAKLGVNLLPKEIRKKKDWTKIKWNAALGFVAILLLGFVMYSSLDNKRAKIESLEAQVSELKKDARRAKLLETQLNESIQAANFLGNLKENMPSRLLMLKELTQMIPSNTYLTRIMIDEARLEVVGQSDNANALVPILNQSSIWYEPQIIGNVTQDARTGKEKFTIKSELKLLSEEESGNES